MGDSSYSLESALYWGVKSRRRYMELFGARNIACACTPVASPEVRETASNCSGMRSPGERNYRRPLQQCGHNRSDESKKHIARWKVGLHNFWDAAIYCGVAGRGPQIKNNAA